MEEKSNIIRQINMINVIKYLHTQKNATKKEIAASTGLSFPTVGKILNRLLETGEVIKTDVDGSNGGRPAERFAINAAHVMILALYMGYNSLEYQVVDSLKHIIVDRSKVLTDEDNIFDRLMITIEETLRNYENIRIISLGVPGSICNDVLHFMPNEYIQFEGVNLKELLERQFDRPILIENDINAITNGLYSSNKEEYNGNLVYLYNWDEGIGMGITIGGKLIRGDYGQAGEVGFIPDSEGKIIYDKIASSQTDDELADALAQIVISSACFINPSYFMLSGLRIKQELKEMIEKKIKHYYVGKLCLPAIRIIDETRNYYFSYLVDAALEYMYS